MKIAPHHATRRWLWPEETKRWFWQGIGDADNLNAWPKNGVTKVGGLKLPLPDPVNQKFDPISDRATEGLISFSGKQVLNEQRVVTCLFGAALSTASYCQSKYKRQYVDDRTRWRDKTWLLSLGYLIDGG